MRRLLLILLLAVLPLQYAWSAAAAYCGHEQGKSQHFGHHAHHHNMQAEPGHAGDAADDSAGGNDNGHGKPAGKAEVHADCAVCHHAVQASLLSAMAPPPTAAGAAYPPPSDPRFSSHIADGPKKPDWHPAA
ncbi:cation efflux protein, CzcI family [Pseudoduganella sp. LjRoot289]|uniref:cation efflux protein, CzcI family n=1 Tax=Pseudoduganella sp. LjRoot289 TaxID=3342314 RepID=UPI003F4FF966